MSPHLIFDIDGEIADLQAKYEATDYQIKAAYHRAITRTLKTMRSRVAKLVGDELATKNLKEIRKRVQSFRLERNHNNLGGLKLWFGLNDLQLGKLRGRKQRLGTKSNQKGARFVSAGRLGTTDYQQGFVANLYKRRSIFQRKSSKRWPVKEQRVEIEDELQILIEDEVLAELPEVFMHHFETDLKGRVKIGLNKTGWTD